MHAKSCDWGPMAGFVLRDPRLNKYGNDPNKVRFNRDEHHHAEHDTTGSGWASATTPLKIYTERIDWLVRQGKIIVAARGPNRKVGAARHAIGINFHYSLERDRATPRVWHVCIDNTRMHHLRQETGAPRPGRALYYEPLLAVTNPPTHRSWPPGDFRNAITGDYDLFAVWPFDRADYDPHGKDRRVLGTSRGWSDRGIIEVLESDFTVGGQGTKLGNMTDRLY